MLGKELKSMYMSSTSLVDPKYDSAIGAILTTSKSNNHGIPSRLKRGVSWCLDNGVFTGKFSLDAWVRKIESLREYKDTCYFVTIPDVVGDFENTLKNFSIYRKYADGFPVAIVSQDGIRKISHKIPWDEFDFMFLGGSDDHKLGKESWWVIDEAKKHSKFIHVGRVNSISRMKRFYMADSWDGTHLGFNPSDVRKFYYSVIQIRAMNQTRRLF